MPPMSRPELHFHSAAFAEPATFRLLSLRGFEGISQLYEFEVELELMTNEHEPLDLDTVETVLREPAVIGFADAGVLEHPWHGIVREMELLDGHGNHAPTYRAVMVPTLWYTTQTVRTRVFLEMSVPDIMRTVLTDAGFESGSDFELSVRERYPVRSYVLQYGESDFDFLARWMEHEGIVFFFDQRADGEVLVITDSGSAFAAPEGFAKIPFDPRTEITMARGAIHQISRRYRVVPQTLVTREYQHDRPSAPMQTDRVIHDRGFGLIMLHGENVATETEQKRICKVRAEERALERHLHHAVSSARGVHPGHRFTLDGHPFGELQDADLVVIAMRHTAVNGADGEGAPFGSEIDLLPAGVAYRAPRITPRPRIDGVVHAKIDGETPGIPAPIDDQGRYKVKLPFDAAGQLGGKATTWIRMTQTFTGPAYGMHFPLHVGADVLIAHVEGDPDRPVIVGALPTPSTTTPVVDANATQSVVRTKGNIVLELEDDA